VLVYHEPRDAITIFHTETPIFHTLLKLTGEECERLLKLKSEMHRSVSVVDGKLCLRARDVEYSIARGGCGNTFARSSRSSSEIEVL
jgi:hypothetical protein